MKISIFAYCTNHMVGTVSESVPVDQQYSRFLTEHTTFLRKVPSQILRHGTVKFRQAYSRFFQKFGGRPKIKKMAGRNYQWWLFFAAEDPAILGKDDGATMERIAEDLCYLSAE